jgi:ABC-type dipeptide/oligopeptide/nickel transport system permease subunit
MLAPAEKVRQRGLWDDFVRRYSRHRLAVVATVIVLGLALIALVAPVATPYDPNKQDYGALLQPPSTQHWMGTDDLGRDYLSRMMMAGRVSLTAGLISVGIALALGLPLGLLAGFRRGWWDEAIMRVTDAFQAFPFLILALAIAATLGPGAVNGMIAIGIGITPGFVRLVRGQVLGQREQEYVVAARTVGAPERRILALHILPNILAAVLVQASLAVAAAIIAEAGLSYLGLGVQPPMPSWGSMLRIAQGYLSTSPHMAVWPGAAIFLAVLSINLVGDGLRDVLDPRLRQ